jgi:predicted TIM-barrel fold metal-dependent hydrolase
MKIIDFRFRPNTPETIDGIKNSAMFRATCQLIGFDKRKAMPLEAIAAGLEARGVVRCVVTGRDAESTYGSPSNNDSVLAFARAYPNLFTGDWGVDPHKKSAAVRELTHAVRELGMAGASIDPYLAHLRPDAALYYPIYAKCVELGIPVVITTAPPPETPGALIDYADPRHIDRVAGDFPELTIVISHGGYPFVNEAIYVTARNANVYMDISEYEESIHAPLYVEAIKSSLEDKLLFASAHPFIEQEDALAAYRKMPLSPEQLHKVMYANAAKILGI